MKACSCFRMIPYRGAPVSTAVTIPVESHWAAHQRWCTHRNVDQGCSLWICCMLRGTQSGRSGCNGRCGAARVHYEQTGKAWLASQILPNDCWQLEWYHQFPRGTAVKRWWLWIKHSKSIWGGEGKTPKKTLVLTSTRYGRLFSNSLRERNPYSHGFSATPWTLR